MDKVLLIDDEKAARESLKRVIEKEGFETFSAGSGQEGLDIFEEKRPEIVITDLKMPDMDGLEVLRAVKKISPQTEVVLLTAYGDYDTVIMALREGAFDYLKKPLDLNELLMILARYRQKSTALKGISLVPTVLVLEDDRDTLAKLKRVLEKEGFAVITADNGEDGIRVLEHDKIDVVLADIKMPKKDGLQVLSAVKELHPDVEVIVLTGYGDENIAAKAMREGAVNFLKKPIDIDLMISAVEKAFEHVMRNRNILYLKRELELSREVIAHISREDGVVVDFEGKKRADSRRLASEIIDAMPTPLFVVDAEMNILFSNKSLRDIAGGTPDRLDEKLLTAFEAGGAVGMDLGVMREGIEKVLKSKAIRIEKTNYEESLVMEMVKLTIVGRAGNAEGVLTMLCGGPRCLKNG